MNLNKNISFSSEIKDKQLQNDNFVFFLEKLCENLTIFLREHNLVLNGELYTENDWEVPEWENIILLIKFGGLPFKKEMEVWKEMSNTVMKNLLNIFNSCKNDSRDDLIDFFKRFYIQLKIN